MLGKIEIWARFCIELEPTGSDNVVRNDKRQTKVAFKVWEPQFGVVLHPPDVTMVTTNALSLSKTDLYYFHTHTHTELSTTDDDDWCGHLCFVMVLCNYKLVGLPQSGADTSTIGYYKLVK